MGYALKMHETLKTGYVSDEGRKAARTFLASSMGVELRDALASEGAFEPWQVRAIVDSVVEVIRRDGKVEQPALARALAARAMPGDLVQPLAEVLSRVD